MRARVLRATMNTARNMRGCVAYRNVGSRDALPMAQRRRQAALFQYLIINVSVSLSSLSLFSSIAHLLSSSRGKIIFPPIKIVTQVCSSGDAPMLRVTLTFDRPHREIRVALDLKIIRVKHIRETFVKSTE